MFPKIFGWIAVFTLFYGIISAMFFDLLLIATQPNMENLKKLAVDVGKTVFSSQEVIKESAIEFDEVYHKEDVAMQYKIYLFNRIIAGSLLSLFILYVIYRGVSFFVPSSKTDLGARLLVIFITLLVFYGCTLAYLLIIEHKGLVPPFHGFIELGKHAEAIRAYLTSSYNQTGVAI